MTTYIPVEAGKILEVIGNKWTSSEELLRYVLKAVSEHENEEYVIVTDGIDVAKIKATATTIGTTHIACDHSCHGCHPRYRELYARLPKKEYDACPLCKGEKFFPIEHAESQRKIMLANTIRMFRGIALEKDGYTQQAPTREELCAYVGQIATDRPQKTEVIDGQTILKKEKKQ